MAKKKTNQQPEGNLDDLTFELDGRKFEVIVPKFIIPGINDGKAITAMEALVTPEALQYLVENQSACIREIA